MPDTYSEENCRIPSFLLKNKDYKKSEFIEFCNQNENLFGNYIESEEIYLKSSDDIKNLLEQTIRFEYSDGGFFEGFDRNIIYKQGDLYFLAELPSFIEPGKKKPFICQISQAEAYKFFYAVYERTKVFDWDNYYDDESVEDGNEWNISFNFSNGTRLCKYGHMMWPKSFIKDIRFIMRYFSKMKSRKENIMTDGMIRSYFRK